MDESSTICGLCIKDWVLAAEIEKGGKAEDCALCGKRRMTWKIQTAAERVHEVLAQRFAQGEHGHDGEQDGESLSDVIIEILGDIDEGLAVAIMGHVIANFNGSLHDPDPPMWDEFACYVPISEYDIGEQSHYLWNQYSENVRSGRRFFNDHARGFLADLFRDVEHIESWAHSPNNRHVIHCLPTGTPIYRGRIAADRETLEAIAATPSRQLHAPPPERCNPGRMNAARAPAFYGSFEPETCVAELRPALSTDVCYAEFRTTRPLRVLDFTRLARAYNDRLSYFDEAFDDRAILFDLLRRLHTLIQAPVRPGEEHEYLVTQVLAEYLAAVHVPPVDGLIFGSVQRQDGRNLVVFGSALGKFQRSRKEWDNSPLQVAHDSTRVVSVQKISYQTTDPQRVPVRGPRREFDQTLS